MHATTKEVITDKEQAKALGLDPGVHILSTTVEADGPFEMASAQAELEADVIALRRTDSGGVFLQVALTISEPKPEAPKAPEPPTKMPTPEELASEYLQGKGMNASEAQAAIERFGATKILQKKNEERDAELNALLSPPKASEPKA